MSEYTLSQPVSQVRYVGPQKAEELEKAGIHSVTDLFHYFPTKYKDTTEILSVAEVHERLQQLALFSNIADKLTIRGIITSVSLVYTRTRKSIIEIHIADANNPLKVIQAIWFQQPYIAKSLHEGDDVIFWGKIQQKGKKIILYNPEYEIVRDGKATVHLGRVSPVYRKSGQITTPYFRRFLSEVKDVTSQFVEYIPLEVLREYKCDPLPLAYEHIHYPERKTNISLATQRLALQELLELRETFAKERQLQQVKAPPFISFTQVNSLLPNYTKNLPFKLTNGQSQVISDLISSYAETKFATDTLLYGDVGSGKTIVSFIIAALWLDAGYSVILLAPTTVLAQQHETSANKYFTAWKKTHEVIKVTSTSKSKKLLTNEPALFIGTHALLHKDKSQFGDLGLVIIDEQHRFGVSQREHFVTKKKYSPHILSLSATPIPRSLAHSFFGFNDAQFLDERPQKDYNISSKVVKHEKLDAAYTWVAEQAKLGKKSFLVFPLIEESETLQASALKERAAFLQEHYFQNIPTGILHGRMTDKEKFAILEQFASGEILVLCCTPVIEVGIDIPDASTMFIHSAERFGLAQLHQLRGRVGRDGNKAYCFLVPDDNETENDRLEYFCTHSKGLDLASYDLKNRGPGNIFGTKQSGFIQLKIADLSHFKLLKESETLYFLLKERNISIPSIIRS